jgi:seryl-tRNA synthetase
MNNAASSDAPLNAISPDDVTLQNSTPLKDNNLGTGTDDDSAKQAAKVVSLIDKTQKVLDELIAIRDKQNNNNNETQSSLENENKKLQTPIAAVSGGKKKLKRKKTHYKKYNSNTSLKRKHKTNKIAHNN